MRLAWIAVAAWCGPAVAEDPPPAAPPKVGLEKLMKLPDSYRADPTTRRGRGLSAQHWRDRFAAADLDIERARKDLSNAQAARDKQASGTSGWQMSAPGLLGAGASVEDGEKAPLNFRLREEIRRRKEALDDAKRAQRDLVVEANLARVPEEWRRPEKTAGSAAGAPSPR